MNVCFSLKIPYANVPKIANANANDAIEQNAKVTPCEHTVRNTINTAAQR